MLIHAAACDSRRNDCGSGRCRRLVARTTAREPSAAGFVLFSVYEPAGRLTGRSHRTRGVCPTKMDGRRHRERWTHWRRRRSNLSQPCDRQLRGGLFAIVATFTEATQGPALLLWSDGPTLTTEDFLRNRRELRGQDNGPSLVLRTDNLHPDRPIQHVFIHTPPATDLESILDALSILDRADLTSGGPAGPSG